jgi:hypothetical protein
MLVHYCNASSAIPLAHSLTCTPEGPSIVNVFPAPDWPYTNWLSMWIKKVVTENVKKHIFTTTLLQVEGAI